MWNLFKEAFRSLRKNKVVIVGLSILVFLVSTIFTLLYDLKTTMTNQYNSYKQISKLHDATVDLNLANQGAPYKNGYTNNGKFNDDLKYNDPHKYEFDLTKWTDQYIEDNFKDSSYLDDKGNKISGNLYRDNLKKFIKELKNEEDSKIIQIKNDNQYIALRELDQDSSHPIPNEYKDLYIKKEEILNLFNLYKLHQQFSENNNFVKFNFDDVKNSFFEFINNPLIQNQYSKSYFLYKKENGKYIRYTKDTIIDQTKKLKLDKEYKLEDILTLSKQEIEEVQPDNSIIKKTIYYASQVASLFVNYQTNEATFNFAKGKSWVDNKQGKLVDTNKLMEILGFRIFKNKQNQQIEYIYENNNFHLNQAQTLLNLKNNSSYSKEDILKSEFDFNLLNLEEKIIGVEQNITLEENKKYSIPLEWIYNQKTKVELGRWFYETTYKDQDKNKWTDEYESFMKDIEESIKSNPNDEDKKRLKRYFWSFSYWKKIKTSLITPYDSVGNLDYSKTDSKELITNITNDFNYFLLKEKIIKGNLSIKDIEYPQGIDNQTLFENISNDKNLIEHQSKMKELVSTRTRNKVIKEVLKVLSKYTDKPEEYIGLRQTSTVDGIDENNKKQIYHFINIGDKNKKVLGIPLNIGKLYDEQNNPTKIYGWDTAQFYKSPQVNPIIASQLIKAFGENLFTDEKYIKPSYSYGKMIDYNYRENVYVERPNTKIVKLATWLENQKDANGNYLKQKLEKDDVNMGIALLGKQYKLVYSTKKDGKLTWINYPDSKNFKNNFDYEGLKKWLIRSKKTIRTEFINTETGWIKVDSNFNSIWYIPIYFQSPKSEIIQNIVNTNSIELFMSNLEKYLMTSELVKNDFLTTQQVYDLVKSTTKILNKHKFYNVLLNSQIDKNVIEKIVIDLMYELTNNKNGNIVESIIKKIFNRSAELIRLNSGVENQQKYLIDELNKIYKMLKNIFNFDLKEFLSVEELVKISKDPVKVIDFINKFFDAIDLKKIFEQAKTWLDTYQDQNVESEEINPHTNQKIKAKFQTKLTKDNWIWWTLNSINQKEIKEAFSILINNIDFKNLFDLDNKSSIITRLLSLNIPNSNTAFKSLLTKIDKNKDGNFTNVKEGLINIINNFDLNAFLNEIKKSIVNDNNKYIFHNIFQEIKYVSQKYNDLSTTYKTLRVSYIKDEDYIYAFFKAMFSVPGSNREFKKNLINMLNLSSAGREFNIGNGKKLYIPNTDPDKLSLLDLTQLMNLSFGSKTQKTIFNDLESLNQLMDKIINVIDDKNNKNEKITFDDFKLNTTQLVLLKKIFKTNSNTQLQNNINAIYKIAKDFQNFAKQLNIRNDYNTSDQNSWTLGEWIKYLNDWKGEVNSELWHTIRELLNLFVPSNLSKDFAIKNISLLSFWIDMIANSPFNDKDKTNAFVNDLLNLAIQNDVKEILNSKDLNDFSNENITLHKDTKLGITLGLAKVQDATRKLFELTSDGKYKVNSIQQFIEKYPELKNNNWLYLNKVEITRNLAFVAASYELTEGKNNPGITNGLYYEVINKVINNYLSTSDFWNIRKIASEYVYNNLGARVSDYLGINSAVLNDVYRKMFPHFLLYYFGNLRQDPNDQLANLQYLLERRILNFEELANDKNAYKNSLIYDTLITSIKKKYSLNNQQENIYQDEEVLKNKKTLGFDKPFFDKFNTSEDYSFFGIDFLKLVREALDSILDSAAHNEVVYTSPSSYVAKVNYAYLERNNKAIYSGPIDKITNPIAMEEFLNKIDQKYILNVNGVKFLIIGADTTADYLYPVVDENNIQTNVKNQALAYVNNEGFARIRLAYAVNEIKNYLLVKNPNLKDKNNEQLKKELQQIIKENIPNNKLERVFKNNEVDPINPERSLRVSTINSIINAINVVTVLSISFLVVLIGISTIFVIRRYTNSKYKVLGILVAQGYSPFKIVLSFTVFAMVTSIIGGVLGYVVGHRLQIAFLNLFSSYWTLPQEVVNFNIFSMLFTVIVPFIGISSLIIIASLASMHHKPIDLISGNANLLQSKTYNKVKKSIQKWNIKRRFSISLIFNGIGKLLSFGLSIVLVAITSMFALASASVFKTTLKDTYENRNYTFRADLETPTVEGGQYKTFYNSENTGLENNLYVPIGQSNEALRHKADYFAPGHSSIINSDNKNGNPKFGDSHILTQFSVNINVSSGVAIDPWQTAYNSMPDTQKARVDQLRHKVAAELMATQDGEEENGYVKKLISYFYHNLVYDQEYEIKYDENRRFLTYVWVKKEDWINQLKKNESEYKNQEWLIEQYENNKVKKADYFKYVLGNTLKESKFVYVKQNYLDNSEEIQEIKTGDQTRELYRKFLINGYKKIGEEIQKQNTNSKIKGIEERLQNVTLSPIRKDLQKSLSEQYSELAKLSTTILNAILYPKQQNKLTQKIDNDYFISFGGVYLDKTVDQKYSYAKTYNQILGANNLYGFDENNSQLKVLNYKKEDLMKKLLATKVNKDDEYYPILINNVVANKYKLNVNDVIDLDILNHIERYKDKILNQIGTKTNLRRHKFKIIGISNTHIGTELITTRKIVNWITGLDEVNGFNGVMTNGKAPQQLVGSTSIYSNSGYWSGNDLFNFDKMSNSEAKEVFDSIFKYNETPNAPLKEQGLLQRIGFSKDQIMKFISNDKNATYSKDKYEIVKSTPKEALQRYAEIYNKTMYTALGSSIYAKTIEVGFTNQIASLAEKIIAIIIGISFVISTIVLVIISNIIIAENEKNIAIWSILGYNKKEKIGMFFSIFVPFIIITLLISIPITYGLINAFKSFILIRQGISLPIYFNLLHMGGAALIIFAIFTITALLVWLSINKMKPVDLLKGRD